MYVILIVFLDDIFSRIWYLTRKVFSNVHNSVVIYSSLIPNEPRIFASAYIYYNYSN